MKNNKELTPQEELTQNPNEQNIEEQPNEKPEKLIIDMETLTDGTLSMTMDEILEKINNTIAKKSMGEIHDKIKGVLKEDDDEDNELMDYKIAFENAIDTDDVETLNEFLSSATKDELGNLTNLVKALGYDLEGNQGSGAVGERGFIVLLNYIYSIALSYYCEEVLEIIRRTGKKLDLPLPIIEEWKCLNKELDFEKVKNDSQYKTEKKTLQDLKEVAEMLNKIWNSLAKEREEIKQKKTKIQRKIVSSKVLDNVEEILQKLDKIYSYYSESGLCLLYAEGTGTAQEMPNVAEFKNEEDMNDGEILGMNTLYKRNSVVQELYNSWIDLEKHQNLKDTFNTKPISEESLESISDVDYLPGFHYKNLKKDSNGKLYWYREGRDELEEILTGNLMHWEDEIKEGKKEKEYFATSLDRLKNAIFSAFLVRKANANTIIIDMVLNEINSDTEKNLRKQIMHRIEATAVGKFTKFSDTGDVITDGSVEIGEIKYDKEKGLMTLAFIHDYEKFKTETLFAYKLYRDNPSLKPTLKHMVLGQKMNGEFMEFDATDNSGNAKVLSLIAGSRSGKGVLTMSMMAGMLGMGATMLYIDSKPDIASMLWTLERDIKNDKGIDTQFVAIDTNEDESSFGTDAVIKANPRYYYSLDNDIPIYYSDISGGLTKEKLNKLRTLKIIQLISLIANNNKYSADYDSIHKYIILDEYCIQIQHLGEVEEAMEQKASKWSNQESEYDLEAIQKRVRMLQSDTKNLVNTGFAAKYNPNKIQFILIGQELGTANWSYEGKMPSPLYEIFRSTGTTLSGNLQVNAASKVQKYNLSQNEYNMMRQGVFFKSLGIPYSTAVGTDSIKGAFKSGGSNMKPSEKTQGALFRSFFCLIANDFNAQKYKEEYFQKSFDKDKVLADFASNEKLYTANTLKYTAQAGGEAKLKELIENDLTTLSENGEANLREEVTFYGLVKYIQQKTGKSDAEFFKGLNTGYDYLNNYFMQMKDNMIRPGKPAYQSLDEYLADIDIDSIYTAKELQAMFEGTPSTELPNRQVLGLVGEEAENYENNIPEEPEYSNDEAVEWNTGNRVKLNQETEDYDEYEDAYEEQTQPQNEYAKYAQEQQAQRQQEQQENFANKGYSNYNAQPTDTFDEVIELNSNPFEKVANGGKFLGAVKELSKVFEEEIHRIYGGMDMVETFEITSDRKIIMNDILFAPRFEEEVIETIPLSIRNKVINGAIADIFSFQLVRKMPGLLRLIVEDEIFANRRVRDELGIPYRKQFSWLFRRMDSLVEIIIGGKVYTRDNPRGVKEERHRNIAENLGEKLDFSRIPNPLDNGVLEKVWNSGPAKSVKSGLAWAGGAKLVMTVAPMFGVWGVVFAGAAAVTAVKHIKNKRRK